MLINIFNLIHPVIKKRMKSLNFGTRNEDISPKNPSVIIPMTTECQHSLDLKLIGKGTSTSNMKKKKTTRS